MRNAVTGSHQIELAGMYEAASAAGIDVADLAGKEPRRGLQTSVRVRRNVHATGL